MIKRDDFIPWNRRTLFFQLPRSDPLAAWYMMIPKRLSDGSLTIHRRSKKELLLCRSDLVHEQDGICIVDDTVSIVVETAERLVFTYPFQVANIEKRVAVVNISVSIQILIETVCIRIAWWGIKIVLIKAGLFRQ